jgi:CRP-like cAMP-binding protein
MKQLAFLRQVPLFANLTDSELQALATDFVPLTFHQHETILYQGDEGEMLYLIQSGRVRIYVLGEEGQEISVRLIGPGEVFGELAVIDDLPRSANAVAMEDTVVLTLPRSAYLDHLRRCPQLALNFMRTLSTRLRYTTVQAGSLAFLGVYRRVARELLELAEGYGVVEAEGVRITVPLTQQELATMVGATRESTNKALAAFRRQGLIRVRRGQIVVVNPQALREYVA